MNKRKNLSGVIFFSLFVFLFFGLSCAEDSLTITTYYPSPYGVYSRLQANSLGVGDNNSNGVLDSGDVPVHAGDAWIKGSVGIGTTNPGGARLGVAGTIKSTTQSNYYVTTLTDLHTFNSGCPANPASSNELMFCLSACNRYCRSKGYSGGTMTEVDPGIDEADCACIP